MTPIIVTGTDTDVGKTVFASALTGVMRARYWKPVQAGTDDKGFTDRERATELAVVPDDHFLPSVYNLATPASPHLAAKIDGVTIDVARLTLPTVDGPLVVEGAGGALVPLTPELLYADVFAGWGAPVVLVARTALGTINHSLLSIEALRARGVAILGVAFVGEPAAESEAIIAKIGKVKRLGRLPLVTPLNAETLRAAFCANFDLKDFRV